MAKIVKKKFVEVELPLVNQTIELFTKTDENLNNRKVKIDLTRKLRGKSLEIVFKIKQEGEKITADPERMHLLGYYIRRSMRKGTDYVEDSFSAECKDAILRIKPFLITRKKVSRDVRKALREKAKEEIEKAIKDLGYNEIFEELLSGKFQKTLSLKLKKVYPLGFTDIRDIFIEKKQELKVKKEKVE